MFLSHLREADFTLLNIAELQFDVPNIIRHVQVQRKMERTSAGSWAHIF